MNTRNYITKLSAVVAAFAVLSFTTNLAPAAVLNASFELPDIADDTASFGSFTNWTAVGDAGVQDYGVTQPPQPTDLLQHAFTNGGGTLHQTLTDVIADGGVYTLTVDVGVSIFTGSEGTIRLFGSTSGFSTPLSNTNGTAELTGIAPPNGEYLLNQSVTYTALASGDPFAGQNLGVALVGSSGTQVIYDNVRLDISAVPEPSTLVLAVLGLVGLAVRRRRRR